MVKISLVAPVYGVEKYIHQFLDSIRKQTFRDFEAILVDDGSKDNCPSILDEFAKEDPRYIVIHQPNGGVSVARNTGLIQASGKYVYIVDSDDWLEPTALETLWNEAERTNADIVYGDWIEESESGSYRVNCFPNSFVTKDVDTIRALQFAVNNNSKVSISRPEFSAIYHVGGAPWKGLFRSSIIRDNHLQFDPYVRGLGDDILFSLHVYEYVRKVAYIQEVIYHYRKVEVSYSHGFKANYLETVERIYRKQEEFLREYNKDKMAWGAYYIRVLIYLSQGMNRYFRNKNNPKPEAELYREYRELLESDPYKSAVQTAPLKYVGSRRFRIKAYLLRMGFYRLYWELATKDFKIRL